MIHEVVYNTMCILKRRPMLLQQQIINSSTAAVAEAKYTGTSTPLSQ